MSKVKKKKAVKKENLFFVPSKGTTLKESELAELSNKLSKKE